MLPKSAQGSASSLSHKRRAARCRPRFFEVRRHRSIPVLKTCQWSGTDEVKGNGQALDNRDCGLTPSEATALMRVTKVLSPPHPYR
jgi:hypothetical protein